MPTHDESKLPVWAQKQMQDLRNQILDQQEEIKMLRLVSDVLAKHQWFTLRTAFDEIMHLWILDKDHPHSVCSIGPGDILLVGRKPKEAG